LPLAELLGGHAHAASDRGGGLVAGRRDDGGECGDRGLVGAGGDRDGDGVVTVGIIRRLDGEALLACTFGVALDLLWCWLVRGVATGRDRSAPVGAVREEHLAGGAGRGGEEVPAVWRGAVVVDDDDVPEAGRRDEHRLAELLVKGREQPVRGGGEREAG
jgi:hypothetical protein